MATLKKFNIITGLKKALRVSATVAIGIQGAAQLLPDHNALSTLPPMALFAALAGGYELARNYWKQSKDNTIL